MAPQSAVEIFVGKLAAGMPINVSITAQYGPALITDVVVIRQDDSPPKNQPMIKEGYGPD